MGVSVQRAFANWSYDFHAAGGAIESALLQAVFRRAHKGVLHGLRSLIFPLIYSSLDLRFVVHPALDEL